MALILLCLSRTPSLEFELTCAISGENDRWRGSSRVYKRLAEVEQALRSARVISPVSPEERLQAANGGISVTFNVEPSKAVALGLLQRADTRELKERTFIRFHDLGGGLLTQLQEFWLDRPPLVGDLFTVDTPIGRRTVTLERIQRSEVLMFGSDETRREVDADVTF